nr:glycosyltransferase [Aurantimonas sp. VKM B-3413]
MRWPAIAQSGYLNFRAPHAVRTSTETLAAILREFNANVFVSPNQIETLPTFHPVEDRKGPLRLLFAALNRKDDWAPEIAAVNQVLKRYPATTLAVDVVFDREFFDALEAQDKRFHPLLPYEGYKALLAKADIAWLPLGDTLFNRCKSDLKFIECAAYGVAILASPVLYEQVIRDGETGLVYRSHEALANGLAALIEDADLRARLVRAAYDEIAATRLRVHHVAREANWYRSLLDRHDALEDERQGRMARLPLVG